MHKGVIMHSSFFIYSFTSLILLLFFTSTKKEIIKSTLLIFYWPKPYCAFRPREQIRWCIKYYFSILNILLNKITQLGRIKHRPNNIQGFILPSICILLHNILLINLLCILTPLYLYIYIVISQMQNIRSVFAFAKVNKCKSFLRKVSVSGSFCTYILWKLYQHQT